MMWFSYRSEPGVFIPMDVKAVHAILEANAKGESPDALIPTFNKLTEKVIVVEPNFENTVGQDSLTRFDRKGGKKPNFKPNRNKHASGPKANTSAEQGQKPKAQGQNKQQAKPNARPQGKPNNKPGDKPRPQNRKPNPPRNDNKPNNPK